MTRPIALALATLAAAAVLTPATTAHADTGGTIDSTLSQVYSTLPDGALLQQLVGTAGSLVDKCTLELTANSDGAASTFQGSVSCAVATEIDGVASLRDDVIQDRSFGPPCKQMAESCSSPGTLVPALIIDPQTAEFVVTLTAPPGWTLAVEPQDANCSTQGNSVSCDWIRTFNFVTASV